MSVESAVSSCGGLTSTAMAPKTIEKARWSGETAGHSKIPVLSIPSQVGRTRIARTDTFKGGSTCSAGSNQPTITTGKSGQKKSKRGSDPSPSDSSKSIGRSATVRYRCCIMPPSPHDTAMMDNRRAEQVEPVDVPTIARVVESPPCHYIVDVCTRAACDGATPAQLKAADDAANGQSGSADGSAATVDGILASSKDDMRAKWDAEPLPPLSSVNAILWNLRGICLTLHQAWWSYEVCVGRHARQFHAGVAQSQPSPSTDQNGLPESPATSESLVFSLGLYTPVESWMRETAGGTSSAASFGSTGDAHMTGVGQAQDVQTRQELVKSLSGPGHSSILPPSLRAETATVETTVVVNHRDPIRSYVRQSYSNGSLCTLEPDWLTGGIEDADGGFAGQLINSHYHVKLASLFAQRAYFNAQAGSIFAAREILRVAALVGDYAAKVFGPPLRLYFGLTGKRLASDASQPAIITLTRWMTRANQLAIDAATNIEQVTSAGTSTNNRAQTRRQSKTATRPRRSGSGETVGSNDASTAESETPKSTHTLSGFGIGRQPARRSAEVRFVCPMASGFTSSPVSVAAAAGQGGRPGAGSRHDGGAPVVVDVSDDAVIGQSDGHRPHVMQAPSVAVPFADSKPVRRQTQIVSVDEVSLCHYQLTVEVPELCLHPAFAERREPGGTPLRSVDAASLPADASDSADAPDSADASDSADSADAHAATSSSSAAAAQAAAANDGGPSSNAPTRRSEREGRGRSHPAEPFMHGANEARAVCEPVDSDDRDASGHTAAGRAGDAACANGCDTRSSERVGLSALPNGWEAPVMIGR